MNQALKLIPEPQPTSRSILALDFVGPAIKGEGPMNYTCGKCGIVLLEGVEAGQINNLVIKCGKCKSFNETAT